VLRIDSRRDGEEWIVRAEGRLSGRWVEELRRVLFSLGAPARRIRLDLAELRYVDGAGTRLLRNQLRAGTRLERRSAFLEALLSGGARTRRLALPSGPDADDDRRLVDRWEGRGALRSWILSIVANVARARFRQEARTIPFSALLADDEGASAVSRTSALEAGLPADPGASSRWREPLESRETLGVIRSAIDDLPSAQRAVIVLRDVAGCEAREACTTLRVSEVNQRVLLHRARSRVRAALVEYLSGEAA